MKTKSSLFLAFIDEPKENTQSPMPIKTTNEINHPPPPPRTKYCIGCDHEFSHRSAFLRHIRRIHYGIYPTKPKTIQPVEDEEEVVEEVSNKKSIMINSSLYLYFDRLIILIIKYLFQLLINKVNWYYFDSIY